MTDVVFRLSLEAVLILSCTYAVFGLETGAGPTHGPATGAGAVATGAGAVAIEPGSGERRASGPALSTDEAIARAIDVSEGLRFAAMETELQTSRFIRERRADLPALSLSYATDTAVTPLSPDRRSRRLSVGLRQTLYDGGALLRARRYREAELILRRRELETTRRQTAREAWEKIVLLQLFDARVRAREEAVKVSGRALVIAEEQFALGRITELDVHDARVSVAEMRHQLRADRLEQQRAGFELMQMLRLPPGQMPVISDGFTAESPPHPITADPSTLMDHATRNDLEFRRRSLTAVQSRENVKQARLSAIPEIAASFDVSLAADTLPLRDPRYSVGIEFSWQSDSQASAGFSAGASADGEVRRGAQVATEPLNRITGEVDRTEALLELEQHLISRERYEEELYFTIRRELSLFALSVDHWEAARHRRGLARRRLRILEAESELGRATPLDLLTASKSLLEAELNFLEVGFDTMTRRRRIEELTGLRQEEL